MSNAKIQLRLPKDLKDAAMCQAEMSGISLNLFVATAIAARVGATSEAARYCSARGSRTTPARAKALLMRLGTANQLREDDWLDVPDEGKWGPPRSVTSARSNTASPAHSGTGP